MNTTIYSLIILLLLPIFIKAQTTQTAVNYNLTGTETNDKTYIARDYIKLLDGYKSYNKNIKAQIDEDLRFPRTNALEDYGTLDDGEQPDLPFVIDKSKPVGTTKGILNVNGNGAATYSVPIVSAAGTNGMNPNISVSYNSSSNQNGILGQGWSLNGISSITRSGKTMYYDGVFSGINFNAEDKFLLDGNRLQTENSTDVYGADGVKYRTAVDNFSEITSYGTSVSGPEWFEVKTKSGLTIEYGHQPNGIINNSKFPNTSNTAILTWYVNKVTDANGNYMTYFYEEIEGNVYIKTILYTGNDAAGLTPYNKIEFYYDNKYDVSIKYVAGITVPIKAQLREIKTFVDGNLLREYNFKYCNPSQFPETLESESTQNSLARNFLWEIVESSNEGPFNSLKFKYGNDSYISAYNVQMPENFLENVNPDVTYYKTLVGDFDGNGLSDFIVFNLNSNPRYYTLYLNNDGAITQKVEIELPDNFEVNSETNTLLYGIRQADINGDGIDELILGFKISSTTYKYVVYAFNGTTYVEQNSITGDYENHIFTIGDFDGNGQKDILIYNKATGSWKVLLNNSATPITGTGYKIDETTTENKINFGFCTGDFNGDNTSELVAFNLDSTYHTYTSYETYPANGYFVNHGKPFISNNTIGPINYDLLSSHTVHYDPDHAELTYTSISSYYTYHFKQLIFSVKVTTNPDNTNSIEIVKVNEINNVPFFNTIDYADYNGDGITDQIINDNFSFGTGKLDSPNLFQVSNGNYWTDENERSIMVDINKDGNLDKVVLTNVSISMDNNTLQGTVYWGSEGNISSTGDNDFIGTFDAGIRIGPHTQMLTGDFDGSGNVQLFLYIDYTNTIYHNGAYCFKLLKNVRSKYLLNNIFDGLGNLTEIKYKPLSDNTVYTPYDSPELTFPVVSKATPDIFAVSEIKTPDGLGGTNTIDYNYSGYRYDIQNNRFLCFSSSTSLFQNQNRKVIKYFDINQVYLMPELMSVENRTITQSNTSKSTPTNNLLSKSTYTYDYYSFDANNLRQRFYNYLKTNTSENTLTGKRVIETINMSPTDILFGNTTSVTTNYNSSDDNTEVVETKSFLYDTKGAWCPSKISQAISSVNQINQPAFTTQQNFEYFNNGNLQFQRNDIDKQSKSTTIEFAYNDFGLVEDQIVSGADIDASKYRTTHFDYDDKGRYIIKTTDPMSYVTENKYDILTGQIIYEKDLNGLETYYKYNSFGTLLETTLPNKKKITNTLGWYTGTSFPNALYVTTVKTEGIDNEEKSYYDCLGRPIRTETTSYNNAVMFSDNIYNSAGQLIEKTEPYVSGTPHKSIKYNYYTDGSVRDGLQLSVENQLAGSPYSIVNFEYDGYTVTTSKAIPEGTQVSSKQYDVLGRIKSSSDNDGTVSYTYYTNTTGLKTEINYGPASTIIETDEYGRQKSLTDPNFGTTLYTYNSFNQLTYQKDAKNKETVLTYDKLGRIKTKTTFEGVTTYTYDTQLKGTLSSIEGYNGANAEYTYDCYGDLKSLKETVDNEQMVTSYDYDDYFRPTRITYPSQFSASYHYNSKGYLTGITRDDNNSALWTLESVNNLGQITKYKYGNNLEMNIEFDSYGNLYKDYSTDNNINYEYQFDEKTGNLEYRKNYATSNNESFAYDVNERLTTINATGLPSKNISYANNSNGNIGYKSDIGNYYYQNTNKPHQITGIDNTDETVSNITQNIDYYSFNKAKKITEDINSLEFTYGVADERIKTISKENDIAKKTTYFSANYEKIKDETTQATRELNYIYAPSGLCAIYEKNSSGTNNLYYIHTDHLGSIAEVVNTQGVVLQRLQYDAWGNRTLKYNDPLSGYTSFMFDRGYTGHEHLDQFKLINMNGRMYDPVLGKMLSADNFVQAPEYSQSYNRYAYCFNNPLKYTDPSGWEAGGGDDGEHPVLYGSYELGFWRRGGDSPTNNHFSLTIIMYNEYENIGYMNPLCPTSVSGGGSPYDNIDMSGIPVSSSGSGSYDLFSWVSNYGTSGTYFNNNVNSYSGRGGGIGGYGYGSHNSSQPQQYYNNYPHGNSKPNPNVVNNAIKNENNGLSLSETGTIATVIGMYNQLKIELIKYGVKCATTPWGTSMYKYIKFSNGMGKLLGYYGAFVYADQAYTAYKKGNKLQTTSNSLMSFYSIVATRGGTPGLALAAPFFIIDWTVGMDNFLLYYSNYGVEQSNQIQNGNWGVVIWRPGRSLR